MSKDSFKILEDAFERATTLEGRAKERFISDFAGQHPELGARLRRMLDIDDATIENGCRTTCKNSS